MDSSRRAVESYWRSRTIDAATSDEDKVTPVYKLEEICDLLRSSHVSIVKELSSFILKRLDHKSPIVKQKALRLIKYAVGKSGVEFRREMQRHSVAIRQLFHYKGVSDPLKGDALNKAVRDTAHEAITAIFSEENKPAAPPAEDRNKRIQGFGSTNYEAAPDDRKSFLSEVVGIGSASIKQGISNLTQSHSMKKNDNNGSYKSPNLHRSLTKETGYSDTYDAVDYRARGGTSAETVQWGQDPGLASAETTNGSYSESKTDEERLLETIVTSGGVRLQPTRDAIQIFLGHAVKSNAAALSHAIEIKLQAPQWQVRMKAVCVLESILRKKEEEPFSDIAAYFSENSDVVVKCSESPQSSLREKANRVLNLLDRDQTGAAASNSEKFVKADTVNAVPMPDLIDTADPDDFYGTQTSKETQNDQLIGNLTATQAPLIDDLFGDGPANTASASELTNDDDPFSDVSFHTNESKEPAATDDLFSGMTLDSNRGAPELFDIFGSDAGAFTGQETQKTDLEDFMGGLSVNENGSKKIHEMGASSGELLPQSLFSDSSSQPTHQVSNDALSGILGPQTSGVNPNFMFPQGAVPYNIGPGLMFNPGLIASQQQINYGAMGNIFAQHFATMSNFQQQLGNLSSQNTSGVHIGGSSSAGDYSPAFPDIFQSNYPTQVKNPTLNSSKKEETKAFDFISDHIAAARDPKR